MEYTKEQVVQFTINILSEIRVPALQSEEIGVPIENAVKNLLIVQKMMDAEKTNNESQKDLETNAGDGGVSP